MSPARDRETVADVVGVPHTRFVVVLALMLALLFWLVGPGADLDSRLLLEVTVGVAIVSAAVAAEDDGRRRWTILFGVLTVLLNAMWGGDIPWPAWRVQAPRRSSRRTRRCVPSGSS